MLQEWKNYKIGQLSTNPNYVNPECQPLQKVYHVAHLETARRIFVDQKIKASLIYDKSKLNQDRILVNWLSPNTWYNGSRYGNVQFEFNFTDIINNKNFYWVESIKTYSPHACRILITDKNYSGFLEDYDPLNQDGPWAYDPSTNQHCWNGKYCLEFMVERDLNLEESEDISFTNHHNLGCCIDPKTCKDKGKQISDSAIIFFSNLISENMPLVREHFRTEVSPGSYQPKNNLNTFESFLLLRLMNHQQNFKGNLTLTNREKNLLLFSSLAFFGKNNFKAGEDLITSFFSSFQDFKNELENIIKSKFGV